MEETTLHMVEMYLNIYQKTRNSTILFTEAVLFRSFKFSSLTSDHSWNQLVISVRYYAFKKTIANLLDFLEIAWTTRDYDKMHVYMYIFIVFIIRDLITFNCFRVFFSLRKLFNFRFRPIFTFNKKEPQSGQFATYRRNALFEFLTSQTGQMAFPIFKVIMR